MLENCQEYFSGILIFFSSRRIPQNATFGWSRPGKDDILSTVKQEAPIKSSIINALIPVVVFVGLRTLNFTLVDPGWSDTHLYKFFADSILAGQQPYKDFQVEYPPLTLVFFLVPGLIARFTGGFLTAYRVEMALFDIGCLLLLAPLAKKVFNASWRRLLLAQILYILLTTVSFQLLYDRFDIAVAFLILLATYFALVKNRWLAAYVVLWLAVLLKLFPILLLPLFLAVHLRTTKVRNTVINIFGSGLLIAMAMALGITLWAGDWSSVFTYHGQRGIQIESLYATLAMIAHFVGLRARVTHEYGAYQISNSFTPLFSRAAPFIMVLSLVAIYFSFWNAVRKSKEPSVVMIAFSWSITTSLLAFMVFNKVLSPQFLLWLYPLAAIISAGMRRPAFWVTFWLLTAAASTMIFPYHYLELIELRPLAILLLAARNLLLVALAYLSFRHMIMPAAASAQT